MQYFQALEFLESPQRFSPRLGLERIKVFLEKLGSPQNTFPSVLIGGTSGKGSSAKMIQAVLTKAGYKVGLFTKPHLQAYRERISIDNQMITQEELRELVEQMVPLVQKLEESKLGPPTYFELGAALSFLYFALKKVDLAVVEVGMGGRLDATNVLEPLVCGINEIGFDHEEYLGHTLTEIASEKAGIIKPERPLIISQQPPEAEEVLMRAAKEKGAPLIFSSQFQPYLLNWSLKGQNFDLRGEKTYHNLFLPLLGSHQLRNAAFALTILNILQPLGFPFLESDLYEGWRELSWPGRGEVLKENPLLLIDGAHNPPKMQALIELVRNYLSFDRLLLVLGVSQDKDYLNMLRLFLPLKPILIATQAQAGRALPASRLKEAAYEVGLPAGEAQTVEGGVKQALSLASIHDLILITGSIYVAGEARELYFPLGP